tara:strand:- start:13031 stop:13486 length:456 start_codon:yes stop_codon:yes gene_type:complete
MANRKFLIRVVTSAGDTTGFAEFADGSVDGGPVVPSYTTTQRNAITSASTGEVIYNSTDSRLQIYNGSSWQALEAGDVTGVTTATTSGLNGGADSGAVTLVVDASRLTDGTSIDVDEENDLVMLYDNSATAMVKVKASQLHTTEALQWMGL